MTLDDFNTYCREPAKVAGATVVQLDAGAEVPIDDFTPDLSRDWQVQLQKMDHPFVGVFVGMVAGTQQICCTNRLAKE